MNYVWKKELFLYRIQKPNLTNKTYPYFNDPFLADSVQRTLLVLVYPDGHHRHLLVLSNFKNEYLLWNVEDKCIVCGEFVPNA